MAHTPPQPWSVGYWGGQYGSPNDWCVNDANGKSIALVDSRQTASFIAAAPDLLAALRKIEQQADYGQMDVCRDIARAAIAKAEGK